MVLPINTKEDYVIMPVTILAKLVLAVAQLRRAYEQDAQDPDLSAEDTILMLIDNYNIPQYFPANTFKYNAYQCFDIDWIERALKRYPYKLSQLY